MSSNIKQIELYKKKGYTIKQITEKLGITTYTYYKLYNKTGANDKEDNSFGITNIIKKLSGNRIKNDFIKHVSINIKLPYQPPIITLDDIKGKIEYGVNDKIITTNMHRGQRKLFLTELEFLTLWYNDYYYNSNNKNKNHPIVIYAGAAPSNHTYHLHTLFPYIKFVLVDPNKFDLFIGKIGNSHRNAPNKKITHIKSKYPYKGNRVDKYNDSYKGVSDYIINSNFNIYIIEDLFTNELGNELKSLNNKCPVLFISDIRTNIGDVPYNSDLLWNLAQQYIWINIINPQLSMLKFRIPFYDKDNINNNEFLDYMDDAFKQSKDHGIDFKSDYDNKILKYFDGTVHIQCFPGQKSTETRLITNGKSFKNWDLQYESSLYYYNIVQRSFTLHKNLHSDKSIGFDHCNDCSKEAYLWDCYNKTFNVPTMVIDHVKNLSKIAKPLFDKNSYHGYLFKITPEYLNNIYNHKYIN